MQPTDQPRSGGTAEAFETIARLALEGARRGVDGTLTDEEPVIVVTVAWRAPNGDPYVVGSAIPDNHGHALLAASLRQSADEADDESEAV